MAPVTIATSTAATATAYSNQRKIDRCQNGVLWTAVTAGTGSSDIAAMYYSTDDGATWTSSGTVPNQSVSVSATYTRNFSLFIDLDDYAHIVFKDNSNGAIFYRRGTPNAGRTAWTWSAATQVGLANGQSDHPDVVAHREGTGWVAHLVYDRGASNSVSHQRVTITSGGTISVVAESSLGLITSAGVGYPSIDFHHTGDGKTVAGSTPHLYVAWSHGATGAGKGIRFKKATYSGGTWTWGTEREIDSTRYVRLTVEYVNCMFDGTRVLLAGNLSDAASNVDIILHERDAADTTTTTRVLADNPAFADRLNAGSATYDADGNVYIIGSNATAAPQSLQVRKWTRSTATLGAPAVIDASVSTPHVSTKRGFSNNRIEFIYTDGTSSPYNVNYDSIVLNLPPTAPTLVAPANLGSVAKGSVGFDWTFNDPDADAQGAYAIRRQRRP